MMWRIKIQQLVAAIGAAGAAALAPGAAWACSVCWAADDPLARGLFWSSIFLAGAPMVLGGGLIGIMAYLHQRQPAQQPRTEPRDHLAQAAWKDRN